MQRDLSQILKSMKHLLLLTQTSKVRVSLKDSLEEDKDESFVSSLKESSKKRHCSGTDTDSYNTLQDNTAELQLMLHTLKDDIVSEVTGIFNKAKISATASAEKSHSEVYDVVESVHKSENIEELKMVLQSCEFLVDIDKRAAFCGICVENPNAIALGGSEKKAEIFQFDIDVPNTLNEMCPAQLRQFLN